MNCVICLCEYDKCMDVEITIFKSCNNYYNKFIYYILQYFIVYPMIPRNTNGKTFDCNTYK